MSHTHSLHRMLACVYIAFALAVVVELPHPILVVLHLAAASAYWLMGREALASMQKPTK